jgi:hypothetical protein
MKRHHVAEIHLGGVAMSDDDGLGLMSGVVKTGSAGLTPLAEA